MTAPDPSPAPVIDPASSLLADRWLLGALGCTVLLYLTLLLLRPTGENWGRGWNLIAFWLYGTPTSLVAVAVALWRIRKTSGSARRVAGWLAAGAFVFPVVCGVVIRMKA